MWKEKENDDSELVEEGNSGSASVDTTLVTPETQRYATVQALGFRGQVTVIMVMSSRRPVYAGGVSDLHSF